MLKKLPLLLILLLSSCVTLRPVDPVRPEVTQELSVFPASPSITPYTRKPIISGQDNNFVVSDEFVGNSLKLKQYHDKVQTWKTDNKIK